MEISDFSMNNTDVVGFVKCRLRAKKQLLILSLADNAQLSLWSKDERLWQEVQDARELEAWLRDVLLAHDVEEGVSLLILLADDLLQTEQLTLPKLAAKQLKKTLVWEAAQLFELPQGSYSFCYQILVATAASTGQAEQVQPAISMNDMQEAEQQVVQLWALSYARQAEYVALAQSLMVKLEGLCVGWRNIASDYGQIEAEAGVEVNVEALEVSLSAEVEVETLDVSLSAEAVAQSWFAGEDLLLLPALPRRIDWQECYDKCERYLPRTAKVMAVCACISFVFSFGLHYLAQADLEEVQQEAEYYAVWQERHKESVILEKRVAKLKQQQETHKPQTLASKELEQWGKLGLTDIYLTELEYKSANKQGKQSGVTVAQGVAVSAEALDALLDKLQMGKQYNSVQLVESQQQAGAVGFKLQLAGAKM